MVTVQDRISLLAIHAGNLNLRALSQVLGLKTPQMLYDLKSGKVTTISSKLANKIFLVFPEVNKRWLLTREGEMLDEETPKESEESQTILKSSEAWKIFLQMSETIVRQEDNISKLTDIIKTMTKSATSFTESGTN